MFSYEFSYKLFRKSCFLTKKLAFCIHNVLAILTGSTCMQMEKLRSIAENLICCYNPLKKIVQDYSSESERKFHKIPIALVPELRIRTIFQKGHI